MSTALDPLTLLAVCVGPSRPFPNKTGATGIVKRPVSGPVQVHQLGLAGDTVADQINHGGPDQAVYIYTQEDYDFWASEGRPFTAGAFGENLLFSGLASASVSIGQRFRIGDVILEATSARIPCETFAAHLGDPKFVKTFRQARRPGIYARVIQPGTVEAGQRIDLAPAPDGPTVLDTFEFFYDKQRTPEQVRRLLNAPVAMRVRQALEEQEAKFGLGGR